MPVEGTWRAHQVPLAAVRENPGHLRQLEAWLRSYRPEELFDAKGAPSPTSSPRTRRLEAGSVPPRTPTVVCSSVICPSRPSTATPFPSTNLAPPCTSPWYSATSWNRS